VGCRSERLRRGFEAAITELTEKTIEEKGILPLIGPSPRDLVAMRRNAVALALVECEILHLRRKRLTPTISSRLS